MINFTESDFAEVKKSSFENKEKNYSRKNNSKPKVSKDDFKKGPDLSKMSSEERIKYYKEKYGSKSSKNTFNAPVSVKPPESQKKYPPVPTGNVKRNNSDKNMNKVYNSRKENSNKKKGLNSKGLRGLFHRIFGKK